MPAALWSHATHEESFDEFIGNLQNSNIEINSVVVLNKKKEFIWAEDTHVPVVEKEIEEATKIIVLYNTL